MRTLVPYATVEDNLALSTSSTETEATFATTSEDEPPESFQQQTEDSFEPNAASAISPQITSGNRETAVEPIIEIHRALIERYNALRAVRRGLPIFCLEHGLDQESRYRLIKLVGAEVRRRGIDGWWRDRYLPLLVAACETGYSYLGTGTDFWPRFSSDIGAEIATNEREKISSLFAVGHREHGFHRPVPTPWNNAFRHIAWPIVNALAPKEIHRPLAYALREAFRNLPDGSGEETLVEALRSSARKGWSTRLLEWLADGDLAAAVSLRLLKVGDPMERLSTDTLDRVLGDLSTDREARRDLERAVALHQAIKSGAPTGQRVPALGRCALRLTFDQGNLPAMSLVAPTLPVETQARLLRAFAYKGARVLPWGAVQGIDPSLFFSGFPVPLALKQIPVYGATFLPGLDRLGIDASLIKRLEEIAPDLSTPIIFRARDDGRSAIQSRETSLSPGAKYVILTEQDYTPPLQGLRNLGKLLGLNCIEADTGNAAAVEWLSQRRLKVTSGLTVDICGGLPVGQGPNGPVFAPGLPIILVPKADQGLPWPVYVRRLGDDNITTLDAQHPFAVIDAVPGQHSFLLQSARGKEEVHLTVDDEDRAGDLVAVEAEPRQPTMDDLIGGIAAFKVTSPLAVERVTAVATLNVAGTEVARSTDILPRLPAIIGPASGLLRGLAERSKWQTLPRDVLVELSLDFGGIWQGRWKLGWALRECFWETNGGRHEPFSDEGPLQIRSILADAPLVMPKLGDVGDSFRLLLPETGGTLAWTSGLCVGPRSVSLGFHNPNIQERLLRRSESDEAGLGLVPCLQRYAAWASAGSSHPLADSRRRVIAKALEAAAVQQFCGELWSSAEANVPPPPADPWIAFISLAISRSLAVGGEGDQFPELTQSDHTQFLSCLQSQFRAAVPDLWERNLDTLDPAEIGEAFDEAVDSAYLDLATEQIAEGRSPCEESYAGKDPAEWVKAIRDSAELYEIRALARLILPESRAASLVVPDYSALSARDVVALLDDVHVDIQPRSRWLSTDDLGLAFGLWTDPRTAIKTPGWAEAADRLLVDRPTARAVRYAALRFRATRDRNLTDGVSNV